LAIAAVPFSLVTIFAELRRRRGRAAVGDVVLLAALTASGIPLYWAHIYESLPRIHDVTTDTENPPLFVGPAMTEMGGEHFAYDRGRTAHLQATGYPDLAPLHLSGSADRAFGDALAVASDLEWEIVRTDPDNGRIEAISTSFWFRYKNDIAIWVAPVAGAVRIDLRSVSRVGGGGDMGVNADLVRRFIDALGRRH